MKILLIAVIVLVVLGTAGASIFVYIITQHDSMTERNVSQARTERAQFDQYVRDAAGSGGAAAEIERAKGLLDSGAINQTEFDSIKQKALAS